MGYIPTVVSYPASMMLLMHMDTASFPDVRGNVFTKRNSVALDTTNKQFGAGSCRPNGINGCLYCDVNFSLGAGPWSVEAWVNWDGTASKYFLCLQDDYTPTLYYLQFVMAGDGNLYVYYAGLVLACSGGLPAGAWAHLRVTYSGPSSYLRVFINGTLVRKTTVTTRYVNQNGLYVIVGARINNNTPNFVDFSGAGIDELRIDNINTYDSDTSFTPPSAPY
jgi:hypothetical protein